MAVLWLNMYKFVISKYILTKAGDKMHVLLFNSCIKFHSNIYTHCCRTTKVKCILNHCLKWDKWVLTNFDHDRQWSNTLIPPSHESAAVTVACWLYFTLEWTREVNTTLYHGRHILYILCLFSNRSGVVTATRILVPWSVSLQVMVNTRPKCAFAIPTDATGRWWRHH